MSDLEQKRQEVKRRLIEENEFPNIPANWGVERLRFLFRESKERNGKTPVGDMLSVSEYHGVIPRDYENEEQMRTDEELENYRVVKPGQLAVNSMWLNHLGLGVSEHTGHVSPAYNVYEISDRLDRRFVHHLMRSNYYLKIYLRYLYGIRPNSFQIKSNDWASIPIIVPDLATQRQIADFLDRETARIDLLIEKKQRLVALLGDRYQRHREEILSFADNGIPEQAMRWLIRVGSGDFISNEEMSSEVSAERPIPVVGGNGIMAYANKSNSPANTLVVGRVGALCGNVHFFEHRSWVTDNALIVRVISKHLLPRYAFEVLTSAKLNEKANKSAQPLITGETVKKVKVRLPGHNEQERRIERLNDLSKRLTRTSETVLASIDRLKEYRSALITAAVTGQIDVTTYAKSGTPDRRLDAIQEEMGA